MVVFSLLATCKFSDQLMHPRQVPLNLIVTPLIIWSTAGPLQLILTLRLELRRIAAHAQQNSGSPDVEVQILYWVA
jgi:hypothetical protein